MSIGAGPARCANRRFDLLRGHDYFTGDERGTDIVAPVLDRETMCLVDFLPPFQCWCHWFVRDASRAMARQDSGSVGHSRYASRALAFASLHFFGRLERTPHARGGATARP